MQRLTRRLRATGAALGLLVVLACCGVAAWAAGNWWSNDDGNTLTVVATTNEDLAEDIATADVVVDVIQIATATPLEGNRTFSYAMTGDFAGLTLATDPTAEDWQALAAEAAALAQTTSAGTANAGEAITGLSDGLYLVLAHGAEVTDTLSAYSDSYEYAFDPVIVALPSKAADADGVIRTDTAAGDWLTEIAIALKPEQKLLYGSIEITKTVEHFLGDKATFVYHLVGTTPAGAAYDNYASITVTASAGGECSVVVTHIPAGTVLTVTEEYTGAQYRAIATDDDEKTIIADVFVSDEVPMATAAFANEPNGSGKHGSGIQNNFELVSTGESESAWDWQWTATPSTGEGSQE